MGNLVELFFMISGLFVIQMKEWNEDFLHFFIMRAVRLLPVVSIAAIMDQTLLFLNQQLCPDNLFASRDLTLWGTFIAALGINNLGIFFNQSVNFPTWYISVLLWCYVLAWIGKWIGKRMQIPEVVLYIVIIGIGAAGLSWNWNMPLFNNATNRGYVAFFIGTILSLLCKKNIHKKREVQISAIAVIVVFLLCFFFRYPMVEEDQRFLSDFLLWPALIIILRSQIIMKITDFSIFGKISRISFDAYVWHANVFKCFFIYAVLNIGLEKMQSIYPMVLFVVVSWLVGLVSFYLIEQPASKWLIDRYGRLCGK